MIYIPLGKALIAVESKIKCNFECMDDNFECNIDCCKGCKFHEDDNEFSDGDCDMYCNKTSRKDGKTVIFKLVNYKGTERKKNVRKK
ncbi:MAG: hypothetical protein LBC76_09045 [Treponema sp.]|jgi:hypothetical protein|nr:hypothetical protein [Treponema sp.]